MSYRGQSYREARGNACKSEGFLQCGTENESPDCWGMPFPSAETEIVQTIKQIKRLSDFSDSLKFFLFFAEIISGVLIYPVQLNFIMTVDTCGHPCTACGCNGIAFLYLIADSYVQIRAVCV